jgi:hypothetical protein
LLEGLLLAACPKTVAAREPAIKKRKAAENAAIHRIRNNVMI